MVKETSDQTKLAVIANDISYIKRQLDNIDQKVTNEYITKDELALINDKVARLEKIVYGVVTLILTAVVGTAMTLILR